MSKQFGTSNAPTDVIDNPPIFILGAPRSGTTMLAGLLAETEYGAPFETHFITKYYRKLPQFGDLGEFENFSRLLAQVMKERPVMQWDLSIDYKTFFSELGDDCSYSNLVNKLCLKVANERGRNNWGDKTPNYLADVDVLYELFPNSKYVYIVRDGRDVALSLLKKNWGPSNVYSCAKYWVEMNRHQNSINEIHKRGNLYQLSYEALLTRPSTHIAQLFDFLSVPYDDKIITQLEEGILKGNFNKWKRQMNERQIEVFESVASSALNSFGYELVTSGTNKITVLHRLLYFTHNFLHRLSFLFTTNIVDGIRIRFFGKQPFAE